MRALRVLLVASPALLIAALGLAHPIFLTPASADRWQLVHLALLPAFPLLAGSLLWLLRSERGPAGWVARVLAVGYAVLYGALDAIAGIGAPQQVRSSPQAPIGDLFQIGDRLGHLGVLALGLAVVLTAALVWRRSRSPLAPLGAAVVVAACVPFYRHHVFAPLGVAALVAVGAGLALLALARERAPAG